MPSVFRQALTFTVLIVLIASSTAAAQPPPTITGTVTTRADGAPVPGATIALFGTEVQSPAYASGRYTIQLPASMARAARAQLRVEALAQPPRIFDVDLSANAPTTFDIALTLGFEEQITVGSRTRGAETEKAVPVDIITQEQIASTGYTERSEEHTSELQSP